MAHSLLASEPEKNWGSLLLSRGADGFVGDLGITDVVVEGPNVAASLPIQQRHLASNGRVHAGVIVALGDSAAAYGYYVAAPESSAGFATLHVVSDFFATARGADILVATARPEHLGRTTQVWSVAVTRLHDDRRVATVRCTQMLLT